MAAPKSYYFVHTSRFDLMFPKIRKFRTWQLSRMIDVRLNSEYSDWNSKNSESNFVMTLRSCSDSYRVECSVCTPAQFQLRKANILFDRRPVFG